jgi:transketolase
MTILAPGDPVETQLATRAMVAWPGPCYMRLGKAGEPLVHTAPPPFAIGQAIRLREGSDVTLISTGGMLKTVVEAADLLAGYGLQARVLSMPTLQPLDAGAVAAAARETPLLVTIEEHSAVGGLHAAVTAVLPAAAPPCLQVSLPHSILAANGSQQYLRAQAGLTPAAIVERILSRQSSRAADSAMDKEPA